MIRDIVDRVLEDFSGISPGCTRIPVGHRSLRSRMLRALLTQMPFRSERQLME
jgi:hypothetical protein